MSARALVLLLAVLFCALSSPAAIVPVFNTNDAFAGSLRQAMQDAPPDSTIVFQIPTTDPRYDSLSGRYVVTLTSAPLTTNKNLTIDGGTQKIWIQRSGAGGTPNFSIFEFRNGGTITLANLTIYNGNASGTLTNGGGGINAFANLTVRNCLFYANEGGGYAGAIYNGSSGNLLIRNCSFVANHAFQNGALDSDGTLTIDNSTFTGNDSNNGGVGGIRSTGSATVRNTIIVGNTGNNGTVAADYRGTFTSTGYNLVGTPSAGGFGFNATGDQAGASPAAANLGSVQDNGGPTWTLRPKPGSVAIDQGNRGVDANGQPINIDQRGYPRPVDLAGSPNAFGGDGSDIGAVETAAAQTGLTFTVTNITSHNDGSCTTDDCTFREAVTAANANSDANVINFAPAVTGTIVDSATLPITNPVTINGPGARVLTLNAFGFGRILNVASANVVISGLTFTSGSAASANGGAITNSGGLTMQDCAVSASNASGNDPVGLGGGIFNAGGATLTLTRCNITGCSAGAYGGGVYNDGILNATNCTFTSNSALRGGGVISRAVGGAAIMTLRNCTVTGNVATDNVAMAGFGGGGVYAEGGPQQHFVGNCLIALNTSTNDPDVRGNYTSHGHNLIGKPGDSAGLTNGNNGDIVGTNATGINPQFGSAGNNGGPTNTTSLLTTSPARNAGDDALAPTTDQRGYPRIGVSDIGAFEFGSGLLRMTSVAKNGSDLSLGFVEAVVGSTYRLERTFELAPASWAQVPSAADYTATQTGAVDNLLYSGAATLPPGQSKVFFRLRLLP